MIVHKDESFFTTSTVKRSGLFEPMGYHRNQTSQKTVWPPSAPDKDGRTASICPTTLKLTSCRARAIVLWEKDAMNLVWTSSSAIYLLAFLGLRWIPSATSTKHRYDVCS
jgi:hypothetical protein